MVWFNFAPMIVRHALLALSLTAAMPVLAAPPISPQRLEADVKALTAPALAGRAPGTPGEAATIAWLVAQLKAIGLQPAGPGGAWEQPVPLVRTQVTQSALAAGSMPLVQGNDAYVSTVRDAPAIAADAPMVFVGYGVSAPERGWDDFKGVDLTGKVAVFLVNDPDVDAAPGEPVAGKFGGARMTYYGRWTYKFEEAARRGAVGALIVHDPHGAGYGWATVIAPGGENYDLVRAPGDYRVAFQGWLAGDAATRLFAGAGQNLATLRVAARRADFKPVALGSLHVALTVANSRVMSRNVLARLPGTTRADEVVMYGAHWDAYGIGKPDPAGATIREGANDDALGVAGLLEVARALEAGPRLPRSVMFGFWTAEERGLLGSEAFATSSLFQPKKTVANVTLDILQTAGPSRDVLLVGDGQSSLEDDLATAARAQGRVVTPEALPERGLFFRADHFSVARRGVPTLLLMAISGAPDLVAGGRAKGQAWLDGYMACYHQPCDRWTNAWDLRGAADDVALAYAVGHDLANSPRWPAWRATSEFAKLRIR